MEDLNLLNMESDLKIIKGFSEFQILMMKYECALKEVTTKFEILSKEFNIMNNRNPVETIKTRLKSPSSIIEKMRRRNIDLTYQNIIDNIYDIAGVRIICSFTSDIYSLIEKFLSQDDIKLFLFKDYILNPKENGYKSLHLIIEVPIYLSNSKDMLKVEVQFRTIAMDFWASLEHKLKYKREIPNSEAIVEELKQCAYKIADLDNTMQELHDKIGDLK